MENIIKNKSELQGKFSFVNFLCLSILFFGLYIINSSVIPASNPVKENLQVLSETDTSGNQVTFYYDSSGQRVAKINPEGENIYYIGPNIEVVVKTDGTYYWRKNYYFNGKLIAVRTNLNESGEFVPVPISTMTPTPTPSVPILTSTPTLTPTLTPTPLLQSCTDYGGYCISSTTGCTGTIKKGICGSSKYICCIPSNNY